MSPSSPAAGELTTFTVTLANRKFDDLVLFHRDDTLTEQFAQSPGSPALSCDSQAVRATEETIVFQVAFRVTGQHHHIIDMGGCGGSGDEPEVFWPLDFTVSGGQAPSNGPRVPTFDPSFTKQVQSSDPGVVDLIALTTDEDGVVDQLTIDWGDGSSPTVVDIAIDPDVEARACDSSAEYYRSNGSFERTHSYATSGQHDVTVTAHSVGCNGAEPHQTSSYSLTVTAP